MDPTPDLRTKFLLIEDAGFNQENKIGWGKCLFDQTHYSPSLFETLNIHYPAGLSTSVDKRQAEFLAGRYAAKLALASCHYITCEPLLIAADQRRCPVWPRGYIGSISHCEGHAICVVADETKIHSLGVDIEPYFTEETANQVANQVYTHQELSLLLQSGFLAATATTLLFSAKESLFKAIYPTVNSYFGFESMSCIDVNKKKSTLTFATCPDITKLHSLNVLYQCQYQLHPQQVITLVIGARDVC